MHDTCSDTSASTPVGTQAGCYTIADQLWLELTDNKVFLANRGASRLFVHFLLSASVP